MRKFLLPVALIGALAAPSTAMAANEYTITASFSPTKSGTSKRPAIVSGAFGFSVRDTAGGRPAALDKLTVDFTGLRMNTRQFAGCSAASITRASSDRGCSSRALVARGFAKNLAGDQANRQDRSIQCNLGVRLYNSGSGRAALFVFGSPTATNVNERCAIEVATAIPVSIVRRASGDRLSFSIPSNLKNPIGTIRNALVETKLTLLRKTVRKSGRTVGFFETVGGCRRGRRTVTARFDNEGTDSDTRQSGFARCSS